MNVELLDTFVKKLLDIEEKLVLQDKLLYFTEDLNQLANDVKSEEKRHNVSIGFDDLETAFAAIKRDLSAKEIEQLVEINAEEMFSPTLPLRIRDAIASNPMDPKVTRNLMRKIISERGQYLDALNSLISNFHLIGVDEVELERGDAEIGFQIPRKIFDNTLDGFTKELKNLHFIINTFSIATIGKSQKIELKQLSTSDPLIGLLFDPRVIACIAGVVTWALNTWKQVEEIRGIRAQTAEKEGMEDITSSLDDRIKSIIDESIETKVCEILKGKEDHELNSHLSYSLEAILERIERGMTVEIRMLPPKETLKSEEPVKEGTSSVMAELAELSQNFDFPKASENPILQISEFPSEETKPKSKKK